MTVGATIYGVANIHVSGIRSTWITDADWIRERNPIRLVSPDCVKGDLLDWWRVESLARIGLGFGVWVVVIAFVLKKHLRGARVKG
jgi:hypothetical protein